MPSLSTLPSLPTVSNVRADLSRLDRVDDAEYFRAPTQAYMESLQSGLWRSVHAERTEPPVPFRLVERQPPYRLVFDFSTFDVSDKAIIRVELEIFGPAPGQSRWMLSEEHVIGIYANDNIAHLELNGTPISRGRLLEISPIEGPWVARTTYVQTLGLSKTVRVAMLV